MYFYSNMFMLDSAAFENEILTDSWRSSTSTLQDLNSASSLSWADDEVENLATFRVQNCLERLDLFLFRGIHSVNCYDTRECQQWRELFTNLGSSAEVKRQGSHTTPRPVTASCVETKPKSELQVTGQSVHLAVPYNESLVDLPNIQSTNSHVKKRLRTGNSLSSGRGLRNPTDSAGTREKPRSTEESEIHHDIARLTITETKLDDERVNRLTTVTERAKSSYTPLDRPRLLQTRPKVKDKTATFLRLPPIETKSQFAFSFATKPASRAPSAKSPVSRTPVFHDVVLKKPASAYPRRLSPVKEDRIPYLYNSPTFRDYKSDISFSVSVIGTSYDPVVRPARSSKMKRTKNS